MSKWIKRTSAALVALAVCGVTTVIVGKQAGERKLQRVVKVAVTPINARASPGTLEQGRYLYSTRGCADCHGDNGAGKEVIRSGAMLVVSPNLTAGANSATGTYSMDDWVRTLRHGVKPDGTPLMIMPSEEYNRLTDDDLAALVAYVTQLPPAAGGARELRLPAAFKVLYAMGVIKDASELIDHTLAPPAAAKPEVSAAHGAYVANSCIGCHGANFSGGRVAGSPPVWPAPANLTPGAGSGMARYPTPELFMAMLRSGKRPDGSAISPVMPFASLRQLNETDARALHRFLTTLPPRAQGQR